VAGTARGNLSIATEACLGTPARSVEQASARLLNALLPKFSSPWLLPGWWPSPRRLKLTWSNAVLTRRLAAATANPPQDRHDFVLDLLSRRTPEQLQSGKPTWPWIKTLLLASQEPTGAAPGWTLHRLLNEPGWLELVRAEVAAVDPLSTDVTVPVRQLPVTAAVVHEALRVHTPTWLVSRRAVTDIEIDGYQGAPGHMVYVSPWLLHQREDLYADPLKFDPDRWLDPRRSRAAHQGYFSFSRGPHSCPGRLASLALTVCLVAALVRNYDMRPADGADVTTDARRSMLPAGLRIHIAPRC
jgi:cytochrome P450